MHLNQEGTERTGRAGATIALLLLAALAGCSTFQTSSTDTSQPTGTDQWLTTEDANKAVDAMAAKGMIPATIDCRFDDTTPGQLAYSSRFTWKRAPANARYHWEVGDPSYLASAEVKSNRVGLHRVFAKTVQDPASGQKVGCSIWTS